MKRRTKVILISILGLLVVGPFLIPVNTSGTLSYKEAAEKSWDGKSEYVELLDHEVHFVRNGDPNADRLIILLHGFGASALSYQPVLAELGKLGEVIAYDRAAFGFTERPTNWSINPYGTSGQIQVLDQLIQRFGEGKEVYVLGHSAGGAIAAAYAIEHPDSLAGLILFAPAVYAAGGIPAGLGWLLDVPQIDHLGPLLVSTIASSGQQLIYASYVDQTKVTDQVLAGYTAPLEITGWEQGFWQFTKADRDTTIGDRLSQITTPTLVVTGDSDQVVSTEDSKRAASAIPGAQLEIIKNSGHLANEEKPGDFAQVVSSFITNN